ncbi:RimK-like ATP-grasp domain-containing protein [Halolactibacillus halophilus]|uniref:RimK-like ATP-grasp domain-containing protein n=1 Tax=Halolactibacillus halophilus TaxID=306540 RepID=A0A1I5RMF5_9BACI|nr:hypothetical protein [Halolactibacillus halophilus]GEM02902.1 hypothetical protein HHA03_24340 [Halolactibacillus halophilus]SFP59580.1 RimK-like ATP-grasp domain-containing protein [Halolactibacillus halophilus]
MNVVILNHYPPVLVDYAEWLSDFVDTFTLIIPEKYKEYFDSKNGYNSVITLKNYFNDNELSEVISEVNSEEKITHIISISEKDTQRAALLREYYGIRGQKMLSATLYRNKFWMKRKVADSGFLVPSFKLVHNTDEIINFIRKYNYPIILKPISEADSIGVVKINEEKELVALDIEYPMLVEEYIECKNMYSIDGVVINGNPALIVAHKYHDKPMENQNKTSLIIVEQLLPGDPMSLRLVEYQKRLLKEIPHEAKAYCFHTEVFHTLNDKIIFCETASRLAGARIPQLIKLSYDIDLEGLNIQTQLGIRNGFPINSRQMPEKKVYSILLPKKLGKVVSIPDEKEIPFNWVVSFSPLIRINEVISEKNGSTDVASFLIISLDIHEDLNIKLRELQTYLDESIVYEKICSS